MAITNRTPIRNVKNLEAEKRLEEASEIKVSFDPGSFKWFNYRPNGRNLDVPMLSFHNHDEKYPYLRLNKSAIERLFGENLEGPLMIEIGVAPRAIAIRKAMQGIVLKRHKNSKSYVFSVSGIDFPWDIAKLDKLPLIWDEKNKMLVGKIPG
ncbi:hypothetical protein [Carboxydothermus pertinax]|uniref:Uncharacterized protein n=1 Tax=Carboxydothermus pertinax TaxID=870242 RepID=A0A1L8CRP6_9THEO|nr:hypothetical protein [Carboxydothermus pertinax]GAV21590.1 hypothetical protein cpu_01000 [Carboxydothermus pertinax]